MKKFLQSPLALATLIGVGILLAVVLVKNRTPLEHAGTTMPSKLVETITVSRIPFSASVTAYGNAEPAITLMTLAEVSGKISYMHPDLKQGSSLEAGSVVIRIDPEDYQVSLKQTQADVTASQSSLKQLQVEEKTTRRSYDLAKKNLQVGEKELERIRSIYERQLVARSTLDAEEQKVISLRQQLEELQGQLNSYASRKASVGAQIIRAEEQVKGQETTLGRTEITLPFNARVGEVSIEKGQFVSIGTTLFEALDINGVEINAQLPIMRMRSLVSHLEGQTLDEPLMRDTHKIMSRLNLKARVRLVGDPQNAHWDAEVLRLSESIDPTRRTLGIVVGVDRPYEKVIPGKRPPLMKGMFTAVEILAPRHEAIVIPRKAVHHGRVYVANNEDKLEIKPVEIRQQQGDLVVIQAGLDEGDRLIINDLVPVIEGMPLQPEHASDYEKSLHQRALGEV